MVCLLLASLLTDILHIKDVLTKLNKGKLRDLFQELGLSESSTNEMFTDGIGDYADDLLRKWKIGDDDVLDKYKGGATPENLKKALIKRKHRGLADQL